MTRPRRALTHAGRVLTRHHVPEIIVSILAAGSIILGADLAASGDDYAHRATFDTAMTWAPAPTWGALLIALSAAVLATLATARHDLYWPLFGMTGWYASWAVALIVSAPNPDVVNSASITYTVVTILLSTMAVVYLREDTAGVTPARTREGHQ